MHVVHQPCPDCQAPNVCRTLVDHEWVAGVFRVTVTHRRCPHCGAGEDRTEVREVDVSHDRREVAGGSPPVDAAVDHPAHYGGADDPYEAIKVIEAWRLGFHLGNAVKYIRRAGRKADPALQDLKKARWYLDREIVRLERGG